MKGMQAGRLLNHKSLLHLLLSSCVGFFTNQYNYKGARRTYHRSVQSSPQTKEEASACYTPELVMTVSFFVSLLLRCLFLISHGQLQVCNISICREYVMLPIVVPSVCGSRAPLNTIHLSRDEPAMLTSLFFDCIQRLYLKWYGVMYQFSHYCCN